VDRAFPRLHVITDAVPVVRAVVGAGSRLAVQVRVGDAVSDRFAYALTLAILDLCRPAGVMCLVNDRVDVAVAAGADGAHVGDCDLPVAAARAVLGKSAVLGSTCRSPGAISAGASYFGVGPAFPTSTKDGLPAPIGPAGVGAVAAATSVPVIAIGGITAARVPSLVAAGAYGVAVVGAVSRAADPRRAVEELLAVLP
jgi:thiamine-phosphate pyrophosphorylase